MAPSSRYLGNPSVVNGSFDQHIGQQKLDLAPGPPGGLVKGARVPASGIPALQPITHAMVSLCLDQEPSDSSDQWTLQNLSPRARRASNYPCKFPEVPR